MLECNAPRDWLNIGSRRPAYWAITGCMHAHWHHPAVAGIRTVSWPHQRRRTTRLTIQAPWRHIVVEACLFLMLLRGRRRLAGVVNSRAKTRPPWRGQLHDWYCLSLNSWPFQQYKYSKCVWTNHCQVSRFTSYFLSWESSFAFEPTESNFWCCMMCDLTGIGKQS